MIYNITIDNLVVDQVNTSKLAITTSEQHLMLCYKVRELKDNNPNLEIVIEEPRLPQVPTIHDLFPYN